MRLYLVVINVSGLDGKPMGAYADIALAKDEQDARLNSYLNLPKENEVMVESGTTVTYIPRNQVLHWLSKMEREV